MERCVADLHAFCAERRCFEIIIQLDGREVWCDVRESRTSAKRDGGRGRIRIVAVAFLDPSVEDVIDFDVLDPAQRAEREHGSNRNRSKTMGDIDDDVFVRLEVVMEAREYFIRRVHDRSKT